MYDYQEGGRTASDGKSLHEETKFKKDTVIEYKGMFLSLPFEIFPRFGRSIVFFSRMSCSAFRLR